MTLRPMISKPRAWAERQAAAAMQMHLRTLSGIGHAPLQGLHAAHAAADHRLQHVDAQRLDQEPLHLDHVLHRDAGGRPSRRAARWPDSTEQGPVVPLQPPSMLEAMTK